MIKVFSCLENIENADFYQKLDRMTLPMVFEFLEKDRLFEESLHPPDNVSVYLMLRRDVAKAYIKSMYPSLGFGRAKKGTKERLDCEVALWKSIEFLTNELIKIGKWDIGASGTLLGLIIEDQLVMVDSFSMKDNPSTTMPDALKFLQNQNKKLMDSNFDDPAISNPFSAETSPLTHRFIDICLKEAQIGDGFRSKSYLPMVRARQKCTALIKKSECRLYTISGQVQKGRKPKSYPMSGMLTG
jgi:hypothetical protein